MPTTLSDRIDKLNKELSELSTKVTDSEDLNNIRLDIANFKTEITTLKSGLEILQKDFETFKISFDDTLVKFKRELISYIILSNASKSIDTASLTETASHLASGIKPSEHV